MAAWCLATTIALISLTTSAPCASMPGSDPPGSQPPGRQDSGSPVFPLGFDSEIIHLTIVGDSLEVNGTYFLACKRPFARPIPLLYPFPSDSLLAGARMIEGRVRIDGGAWQPLRFEAISRASGVRWWVPPCAGRMIEIQGRYRQGLGQKYARYIVTTTRGWRQPLRHARFEIRLPVGAEPVEFSFPFKPERDSSGAIDSSAVVYVWETDSFFPDRDITVHWR